MATDSAILTVAREVYSALEAVKSQQQVVNTLAIEHQNASRRLEELKVRQSDAERRLQSYAQQKPAEPVQTVTFSKSFGQAVASSELQADAAVFEGKPTIAEQAYTKEIVQPTSKKRDKATT